MKSGKNNDENSSISRICMKYIQAATERMKNSSVGSTMEEPSLLERVLKSEKNEKLACIMALDLILVGIDTVS